MFYKTVTGNFFFFFWMCETSTFFRKNDYIRNTYEESVIFDGRRSEKNKSILASFSSFLVLLFINTALTLILICLPCPFHVQGQKGHETCQYLAA